MQKKKPTNQTWPFHFFLRVAKAVVPELTEATFGLVAHAGKTEIWRFALRSALCMRKRHKAEVSLKFPKENIRSAKLQAE